MAKHDPKAIQIMKDFVEGRMSIQDFKVQFDKNPIIKNTFAIYPNRPCKTECGYDYIPYMEKKDINTRGGALCWQGFIEEFLKLNNYPCTPTEEYSQRFIFLLQIQPGWLDIIDETFLNEQIISKMPVGLTEPKQIKWCKDRIKELFRYDARPPRWVQSSEWPIVNSKPLVFKGQSKTQKDDERVYFYFYDPDTGVEETVTQMY